MPMTTRLQQWGLFVLFISSSPFLTTQWAQSMSSKEIALAETFITTFYSFDAERLAALMTEGADADRVLYYQGWAEAAHYQIKTRAPCVVDGDDIVCAITVTDDFGKTLGYEATDTFRLQVTGNKVSAASFSGDDPPVFNALFAWIAANKPEILSGPCKDLFDGGTTPALCARAVVDAAQEFVAQEK